MIYIKSSSVKIVGSIVNALLFMTALNLKGTLKIVGVVTMPSIATILSGYIFHTASVFMVYMIPAICLGNFALIYIKKIICIQKNKLLFNKSYWNYIKSRDYIWSILYVKNNWDFFRKTYS